MRLSSLSTFAILPWLCLAHKIALTQALSSSTLVLRPAAAVASCAYRRRWRGTPDAMADLGAVGRLGWWLRSFRPADSLVLSLWFCQPGSKACVPIWEPLW